MALTGENFMRIDRHNSVIREIKDEINTLKEEWTKEAHNEDGDPNKLNAIARKIDRAEYRLYCAEYEDNRRRTW